MTLSIDAAALRHHRLAAGFTERALARRVGTSPLTIRRLEAGGDPANLTLRRLSMLCDELGISPTQLLVVDSDTSPTVVDRPPPQRALTLAEATVLLRALHGRQSLIQRGPQGATVAHLVTVGLLDLDRPDPERAAVMTPSAVLRRALPAR